MTEIDPQKRLAIQSNLTPKEIKQTENIMPPFIETSAKEMTQKDLGNVPAAVIGQSQIQVIPQDSLEEDLKTFIENPELVKKSLVIGEKAEENLTKKGIKDADLKALNVAKAFCDEFSSK